MTWAFLAGPCPSAHAGHRPGRQEKAQISNRYRSKRQSRIRSPTRKPAGRAGETPTRASSQAWRRLKIPPAPAAKKNAPPPPPASARTRLGRQSQPCQQRIAGRPATLQPAQSAPVQSAKDQGSRCPESNLPATRPGLQPCRHAQGRKNREQMGGTGLAQDARDNPGLSLLLAIARARIRATGFQPGPFSADNTSPRYCLRRSILPFSIVPDRAVPASPRPWPRAPIRWASR